MLRVNRIGLRAVTGEGRFVGDLALNPGINILQAGNTSGKSTCLQAIVYGLGLERMWGPRVGVPLAHAMQERIQKVKHGAFTPVLESWVEIEIENKGGQVLVVRRDVAGGADRALIRTSLTEGTGGSQPRARDFYIHHPGAAQREDGFHSYLARFIGWELPLVPRFNGSEVPLYLETIFPMLFVEQKRGWSAVQGPFPTHLQIQDVARRVMEFLLDLEIGAVLRELAEIRLRLRQVRERWSDRVGDLRQRLAGGCRIIVPSTPTAEFALAPTIRIEVLVGEQWQPFEAADREVSDRLVTLSREVIPSANAAAETNTQRLSVVNGELERLAAVSEAERSEFRALQRESAAVAQRLATLREDLLRHQDAIRLRNLGSVLGPVVSDGHCPTCHQSMAAELLAQAPSAIMALEENIAFLRSQIKLYEANGAGIERALSERRARGDGIDAQVDGLRAEARALREALTQASSAPSRAHIAEIVRLETRKSALAATREQVDGMLDTLAQLAGDHVALAKRQKELEAHKQSTADRSKLGDLLKEFRARLQRYGFSSLAGEEVVLAEDNFRPVMEQRDGEDIIHKEIGLNLSASDGVRLKWAYQLALLAVARHRKTNHPGFLVLDEPGQHQMELASMEAFLQSIAEDAFADQQVIVATSLERSLIDRAFRGYSVHVLSFDGLILQPDNPV